MSVTFLLPAKNEEASVELIVRDLYREVSNATVLVVNDGSTDRTEELALGAGAVVWPGPAKGKALAIRSAIPYLTSTCTVMLDSDCTYTAADARRVANLLSETDFQVVAGQRTYLKPGAMRPANRFGNRMLSALASFLYWTWVPDLCTGLWGFETKVLQSFDFSSNGFDLEADIFVNTLKNECLFGWMPIEYYPRLQGSEAKIRWRHGWRISWFLFSRRFG